MNLRRPISYILLVCFCVSGTVAQAVPAASLTTALPAPGEMISLGPAFEPLLIKGLKIHPENPFAFDFILDTGRSGFNAATPGLQEESQKLVQYFLAAMTIPEKDLWVNLSPYEKGRVMAGNLGQTQMGRDMLAQDYILKQLAASLIYPEKELGKEFWQKIYAKAGQRNGNTEVPINAFHKVWIVADKADIFERGNAAYVVGAHLKVMMEEDYLALGKNKQTSLSSSTPSPASQMMRELIVPEIEHEVNTGKNFAPLRQMFYAMILASWYKMALKDAILSQVYGNQSKVKGGIEAPDLTEKDKIFERYEQAYKRGVFNYIKEERDALSQRPMPRKYFSGGVNVFQGNADKVLRRGRAWSSQAMTGQALNMRVDLAMGGLEIPNAADKDKIFGKARDPEKIEPWNLKFKDQFTDRPEFILEWREIDGKSYGFLRGRNTANADEKFEFLLGEAGKVKARLNALKMRLQGEIKLEDFNDMKELISVTLALNNADEMNQTVEIDAKKFYKADVLDVIRLIRKHRRGLPYLRFAEPTGEVLNVAPAKIAARKTNLIKSLVPHILPDRHVAATTRELYVANEKGTDTFGPGLDKLERTLLGKPTIMLVHYAGAFRNELIKKLRSGGFLVKVADNFNAVKSELTNPQNNFAGVILSSRISVWPGDKLEDADLLKEIKGRELPAWVITTIRDKLKRNKFKLEMEKNYDRIFQGLFSGYPLDYPKLVVDMAEKLPVDKAMTFDGRILKGAKDFLAEDGESQIGKALKKRLGPTQKEGKVSRLLAVGFSGQERGLGVEEKFDEVVNVVNAKKFLIRQPSARHTLVQGKLFHSLYILQNKKFAFDAIVLNYNYPLKAEDRDDLMQTYVLPLLRPGGTLAIVVSSADVRPGTSGEARSNIMQLRMPAPDPEQSLAGKLKKWGYPVRIEPVILVHKTSRPEEMAYLVLGVLPKDRIREVQEPDVMNYVEENLKIRGDPDPTYKLEVDKEIIWVDNIKSNQAMTSGKPKVLVIHYPGPVRDQLVRKLNARGVLTVAADTVEQGLVKLAEPKNGIAGVAVLSHISTSFELRKKMQEETFDAVTLLEGMKRNLPVWIMTMEGRRPVWGDFITQIKKDHGDIFKGLYSASKYDQDTLVEGVGAHKFDRRLTGASFWVNPKRIRPDDNLIENINQGVDMLSGQIVRTPLEELKFVSKKFGKRVLGKNEAYQKSHSYKIRGVLVEVERAIQRRLQQVIQNPALADQPFFLVTQTAGNHGIALIVATTIIKLKHQRLIRQQYSGESAARLLRFISNVQPVVFTSKLLPQIKKDVIAKDFELYQKSSTAKAKGVLDFDSDDYFQATEKREAFIANNPGNAEYMAHGYDDVIYGHASIGVEIAQQLKEMGISDDKKALIVFPAGAGGLVLVGAAAKSVRPNTKSLMVQTEPYRAFVDSLIKGQIVRNIPKPAPTITLDEEDLYFEDGIGVVEPEKNAFEMARRQVEAAVAVNPRESLDIAAPWLLKDILRIYGESAVVSGTFAAALQALREQSNLDIIKEADVIVVIGTEHLVHPKLTEYVHNRLLKIDRAMNATGGIDLNRSNLAMNVARQGQGVQMQFDPVMIEQIKGAQFDGMNFYIRSIVAINNLPAYLN